MMAEHDGMAVTSRPPYVAVIFTSIRREADDGYAAMSAEMAELAAQQPGYLGVESARDAIGITVSYWRDERAAQAWNSVTAHLVAQHLGRAQWYETYRVRVAVVQREYGPETSPLDAGRRSVRRGSPGPAPGHGSRRRVRSRGLVGRGRGTTD